MVDVLGDAALSGGQATGTPLVQLTVFAALSFSDLQPAAVSHHQHLLQVR